MIRFKATIQKYGENGEKSGWSYISIPDTLAQQLKPGWKKSFRVKGRLDQLEVSGLALIPVGGGNYILALKSGLRKQLRKEKGAVVVLELEEDKDAYVLNAALMDCLADEPAAMKFFQSLAPSHQVYFSKWIDSARTEGTQVARIARAVSALAKGLGYSEMLRADRV